jgi:hypothetical protein
LRERVDAGLQIPNSQFSIIPLETAFPSLPT